MDAGRAGVPHLLVSMALLDPLPHARRVMLKVSGEALAGAGGFGIDPATLSTIAAEVAQAVAAGLEVAIVVGGGNFFRGVDR